MKLIVGSWFDNCWKSAVHFIRRPIAGVHRGAFCQFLFRWIYYYDSNKSTGKETGKTHLCGVSWAARKMCCMLPSKISVVKNILEMQRMIIRLLLQAGFQPIFVRH